MAAYREEAQEALEAIQRCEPGVVVQVRRRWFASWNRRWYVRVDRPQGKAEYESVEHYWLERALVNTFCRPL